MTDLSYALSVPVTLQEPSKRGAFVETAAVANKSVAEP